MTFKRHNIEIENKFVFNGNDLSNLVVVERINRQLLPSIINDSFKNTKYNGRKFQSSSLNSRFITLTLRFIEETYKEVQERALKVSSLLYSSEPKKLELRDTNKYNYAIVSQITDIEKMSMTGTCEVVFECFDVYNYGDEKIFSLSPITEITNAGTAPTKGVFNLKTESGSFVKVTLNEGKFLLFNAEFLDNANLTIDLINEYATINGFSLMDKLTLDSDFFDIPSGNSSIKIEGATGTFKMSERWY